jgi:hypothetical protein
MDNKYIRETRDEELQWHCDETVMSDNDDDSFGDPRFQPVYSQLTKEEKIAKSEEHHHAQVRARTHATSGMHAGGGGAGHNHPPQLPFGAPNDAYYARCVQKDRVRLAEVRENLEKALGAAYTRYCVRRDKMDPVQRAVDDLTLEHVNDNTRRGVKCALYMLEQKRGGHNLALAVPPPLDLAWGKLISRSESPPNARQDFHSFWWGFTETWNRGEKVDADLSRVLATLVEEDWKGKTCKEQARALRDGKRLLEALAHEH